MNGVAKEEVNLVFIYNIFQNFIQSMPHMQIAIRIGWAIMKNKASLRDNKT